MRALLEKKPLIVLLAILALGALTVLSVSLRNVSFNDPQPVGWADDASMTADGGVGTPVRPLIRISSELQIGLFVSLLVLSGLVSLLISAEARKRFLRLLFRLALTYWVLMYVLRNYSDLLTIFNPGMLNELAPAGTGEEAAELPPAIFTPPQPTPLLSYMVSVLIVLVVGFVLWRVYLIWKRRYPSGSSKTLENLARIARQSLKDLTAGNDSTDVILKCYSRMSDVVANKKNMHRGMSVTPAEFAVNLERSGLPGHAVKRLTRLFESVRYGGRKAGPTEINEAVVCLTSILQYCGEP
ncbi:MAG: DUF4129 domain-containing protein, partial [Anaerolineales bacterium]|nr:DUF4129 domain-containing protein [Anaerolineales bacterium]